MQWKELERKIDRTIAPLLATVYFLQFLDKTTLSYTAVMEIRTDTRLKGQLFGPFDAVQHCCVAVHSFGFVVRNENPKKTHRR